MPRNGRYLYAAKSPRTLCLRYLFPLVIGVGASGTSMLIDVARGMENRPLLLSDFFDGIVTALLAFFVVRYYEHLRQLSAERLRVAADVNHHVRNALTTVLYSVYVKQDPELIQVTQDAVNRVDRALREDLWESDEQPSSAGKRLG
jgi:hypothetical protein